MNLELISRYPSTAEYKKHLLFVHGAWHSAWCWDKYFLPYFSRRGFAAHALSLRGHGKSDSVKNIHMTRIADYVEDVAEIAKKLPESPVVIGHSMGGFVVQKYLESNHTPAAILLASAPPAGMHWPLLRLAARHPLLFAKSNLLMNTKCLVATPSLAREVLFSVNTPPDLITECMECLTEESIFAFFDILMLNHVKTGSITAPLMVAGSHSDNFFSISDIEKTARAYNTQAVYFEGLGHDMMLEGGWQEVANRMIEWLEKVI